MKRILIRLTVAVLFVPQIFAQNLNRQAVEKVVAAKIASKTLETAMLDALKRHPTADRWSGVDDKQVFGLGVVTFTDRDVRDGDIRLMRTTARLIAAKEMLFAKVLLDQYAEAGLADPGSLREAVAETNESFTVQGTITDQTEETVIEGDRIVGIVVADKAKVIAAMTSQDRVEAVRVSYHNVVTRRAKRLIVEQKFEESLHSFVELRQAKLLNREHRFDILRCFVGLDQPADAAKIIVSLIDGHAEDVALLRRLVGITATGESDLFRDLTHKIHAEVERLDPPEMTAEMVLEQLLNELSGQSPVQ